MLSEELVEISGERFIIDLMYASEKNMTMYPVYEKIGFGNRALVRKEVWECLQKIIPYLEEHKLKMKICDVYRPPIAHMMLKDIIPTEGFFAPTAEQSLHCHGTAIDCCLTDETGNCLIYPTEVDAFDEGCAHQLLQGNADEFKLHLQKARHDYDNPTQPEAMANRQELKNLMEAVGFESLMHEWWHYNLVDGRNFPIINWKKD